MNPKFLQDTCARTAKFCDNVWKHAIQIKTNEVAFLQQQTKDASLLLICTFV